MSRNKMIRMTMGGILLAMALAAGISVYDIEREITAEKTTTTAQSTETPEIEKKVLAMPETADAGEHENTASDPSQTTEKKETDTVETAVVDVEVQTEKDSTTEDIPMSRTKAASAGVSQVFTEDSIIDWPVEDSIVLDYSMDETTYFSTLNVYKCNPAVLLKAKSDEPVHAAYAGTVKEIFTSAETGDTLVVDMGNGYEATYGQLKNITVSQGDTIQKGMQIGSVCEPTKYYKNEGTNLYFGMTKDDVPVDPALYTESLME